METRARHFVRINKEAAKKINKIMLYEFNWNHTAEGYDYWKDIYYALLRIQDKGF